MMTVWPDAQAWAMEPKLLDTPYMGMKALAKMAMFMLPFPR